jgi:hypothetical protein
LEMDGDYDRYEQWIAYMADAPMQDQFRRGPKPTRSYAYKVPGLIWGEYQAWAPRTPGRGVMRVVDVPIRDDYTQCLGCQLGARVFRAPGEEHHPACLLGRAGPVGPDDWRLTVLAAALRGERMIRVCAACGHPATVTHHDHSAPCGSCRAELIYWAGRPQRAPRFAPAALCRHCNAVDAVVKRKLGLPTDFSLCPEEISLLAPPGAAVNLRAARALVACLRWRGVLTEGQPAPEDGEGGDTGGGPARERNE